MRKTNDETYIYDEISFDKNNTVVCGAMKTQAELAEQSDEVYAHMDIFAEMLIAANARCAHVIISELKNPVIARG